MDVKDIAHALRNICRWGGHCNPFFSVGQHACLVSDIVYDGTGDSFLSLVALHHDDHESVRGDIPRPRKRFLKKHRVLFAGEELREDAYIYRTLLGLKFPFDAETKAVVHEADNIALMTERKYLKPLNNLAWIASDETEGALDLGHFRPYQDTLVDWADEFLTRHKRYKSETPKERFNDPN